jgi:hypothetical protein
LRLFPEKLSVKRAVFADLEKIIKPDAILATNTSAIPLEDISTALKDPSRLIGLHFFNPVPVLPLVEVIWSPLFKSRSCHPWDAVCRADWQNANSLQIISRVPS